MGRFGNFIAQFFARDDLDTPLREPDGITPATRVPVSGSTEMNMSAEGRTDLLLAFDEDLAPLVAPGNVVIVSQGDAVTPGALATTIPFCMPFEIETVEDVEPGLVRIEGPDLLSRLKDLQRWAPIGTSTATNTTVATAVIDPFSTTVASAAATNHQYIGLASSANWQEGDEARIELDGLAGTHVTVVVAVNPEDAPYTHTIQLRDRLPYGAGVGNTVTGRRRKVEVAAATAFQVGVECRLTMDNSSVHTTLIVEEPDENVITMRDGAPDSAAVGKAVQATDFSQPTTSDVDEIMSYFPDWQVIYDSPSYTGTAAGTAHQPNGESLYDLLVSTSQRTGEFFRGDYPLESTAPNKRLYWKRSFDYAGYGGNLRLVKPSHADIANEALNYNRAIITGEARRSGKFLPVTRVVPYAGDQRITLMLCSEGAKLDALARGFTVVTTGLGLYTPPYVKSTAAETEWGIIGRTVTFSEIRVDSENTVAWQSAADALLMSAVYFMQSHGTGTRYQYVVEDVVHALPILPGQRVEMVYTSPDGRWSVNKTGSNALYVLSVRSRFEPPREEGGVLNGGVKLTTLTLVESPYDIPDIARSAAGAIANVSRLARAGGGGGGGGGTSTTTVITGGTASDHGALTGLNDDDHPRYLLADGTRTMTGDLTLEDGKRVDGVDISLHAADPAAHHAPVTPGNSGVVVVDQMIGVNLALPSALEIVDGLQFKAAAAGNGLRLDNQVLSVRLATTSGLLFSSGALTLGTPGAVSAVSGNAVTATSHTHAADASANPGAATKLLKTDESGYLRLFSLGIGTAPDGVSGLKVMSPQPTWFGLYLKQRSDQVASMFRAEAADGTALILLTPEGDLESGNPGFVSGLTGWQISHEGDAEFNNVRVRGELHATTFVADEMHATGGTMLLASATTVAEPASGSYNNTLKSIDVTATTYIVVNASWATGLCYFSALDIVRIKSMGEVVSGGSLYIPDIYLEVVEVIALNDRNLAQGNPGRHVLRCIRKSGGQTNYVVPAGSSIVKWTKSNQGVGAYKGNMLLTADLQYGPYIDVFTVDASLAAYAPWPGSGETRTAPTIKPRVRLGNLDGVLGLPEQWGMAAGTDLSDTSTSAKYIVASDQGVQLRNIDISQYSGANRIVNISPAGIKLLNSEALYVNDRSLRWEKSNGVVVGAMAVREIAGVQVMEMGVGPTFGFDTLTEHGIVISKDTARAYGSGYHDFRILSWGRILLSAGTEIQLNGTHTQTNHMRVGNGLLVGSTSNNSPSTGIVRLAERSGGAGTPPSGFGDLFLVDDGAKQILYFRFENGALRELARSI